MFEDVLGDGMIKQGSSTRNMKNVNFAPKDVHRILSSHKISEKYNERKVFHITLFLKILQYFNIHISKYSYINFAILFLMKMQPFRLAALLKRDSNTSVFLSIFRDLEGHL